MPDILIIDEITAVLDIVGRAKFMTAIQDLRERAGTTVLMATNILDDVDAYATDVILLHQGKLTVQAEKDKIIRMGSGKTLTAALAHLIEQAELVRGASL